MCGVHTIDHFYEQLYRFITWFFYLLGRLLGLFWWPWTDWEGEFICAIFPYSIFSTFCLLLVLTSFFYYHQIGTDIEDFKCSWLVVKALELCNEEQKKILFVRTKFSCIDTILSVSDNNMFDYNFYYRITMERKILLMLPKSRPSITSSICRVCLRSTKAGATRNSLPLLKLTRAKLCRLCWSPSWARFTRDKSKRNTGMIYMRRKFGWICTYVLLVGEKISPLCTVFISDYNIMKLSSIFLHGCRMIDYDFCFKNLGIEFLGIFLYMILFPSLHK